MKNFKRGDSGYTMLEAMITLFVASIIFGLLAMSMKQSMSKAKAHEAIAALESISDAMRRNATKSMAYNKYSDGTAFPAAPFLVAGHVPGFPVGSLNGTYFVDGDYVVTLITSSQFYITATGSKSDVQGIVYRVDELGYIVDTSTGELLQK